MGAPLNAVDAAMKQPHRCAKRVCDLRQVRVLPALSGEAKFDHSFIAAAECGCGAQVGGDIIGHISRQRLQKGARGLVPRVSKYAPDRASLCGLPLFQHQDMIANLADDAHSCVIKDDRETEFAVDIAQQLKDR